MIGNRKQVQLEQEKFVEYASNPSQVGIIVLNPDGTTVGAAAGGATTVVGNVAHDAVDSGNPVKVGGKYNSSDPTLADGDRGDLQLNNQGKLKVIINDQVQTYVNDNSGEGSLSSLNATTSQDVSGRGSASIDVSGTFVGTVTFQASADGTTWFNHSGINPATLAEVVYTTTTNTAILNVSGLNKVRAIMSAYTSGTAVVRIRVGAGSGGGLSYQRITGGTVGVVNGGSSLTVQPGNTANTTPWFVRTPKSGSPSQSSVSVTNSNTWILGQNTNRSGATFYNEGASVCYLKLGSTASLTSYTVQIASGGYYESPFNYTGEVYGITSSGTAQLRITEMFE